MERLCRQTPAGGRQGIWLAMMLCAWSLLAMAGTAPAFAQETRGSIAGRVSDSGGAVLPGVTVTVMNVETNSTNVIVTNDAGQYNALFLQPGTYSVSAELSGFRKSVNPKVPVRVGDKVVLDFTLEPGGITEEVKVVADRPTLDHGSATMGQVIDSKLISEIPLGDGTSYGLARLAGGGTFERSYALQRPMDNDNLRGFAVAGTMNSEFTIDGSSNVVSQARAGIQPPADAVQEFKVETAVYDAQVGHTGAGNINLAIKSGTNQLHGAGTYFNRDDTRSAHLFASNARGGGVTPRNYNRYSGTVGGPIFKNKTFFLGSYENLEDDTVETFTSSVPTAKMRAGDFSELLAAGIQIYNPYSAHLVNGVVVRDAFPGNIIPANLLNPIAQNVLKYYPLPNQVGNADTTNNYFVQQPWNYSYHFEMARIDQEWTSNNHSYVRWIHNFRREERYNWAGVQNGTEITRGATDRYNLNVAGGHTAVFGNSWFLDLKASFLRFNDDQIPLASFDPATLGYPASTLGLLRGYEFIPRYSIESGTATTAGAVAILGGQQNGFNSGRVQPFYNLQFAPTMTKTSGAHTVKLGYDWRLLRQVETNAGWQGGVYGFDGGFTNAANNASTQYGQGIASFVLGLPTNNSFLETHAQSDFRVQSHGVFVQDDWRVSDRLTLNLGVRYDLELGMTEAQNRNIRGFDLTTASPIQAAAAAKFAANPPAGVSLTAAQFASRLVGGYTFASSANPHIWNADANNVQPRFGASYKLTEKSVLRGGIGSYTQPFQIQGVPNVFTGINQINFSRNTPVPVSADSGLTFQANLTNPVPSGALLDPIGAGLGLSTNLGGNAGSTTAPIIPLDRNNAEFLRYSIGYERELPGQIVFEISYLGQRGRHLPLSEPLNYVPQEFRTTGAIRDTTAETFLTQTVANPFQGLFPDNPSVNQSTIARRRLLLQYPQFDQLYLETSRGSNTYNGLVLRADKRFTNGLMVMTTYTFSKMREQVAPLNPWEGLEDRVGQYDRPHRFTFATVIELPFGTGRRFGRDWNGALDAVLGGWQLGTKYEWQMGQPMVFNNNTYYDPGCGDPKNIKSNWGTNAQGQKLGVDVPMLDTSCFYTLNGQAFKNAAGQVVTNTATEISLGNANIRTFPTTLPDFRFQNQQLLDAGLTKNFQLGSRVRLQVRIEALNATNFTLFNSGNLELRPTNASFGKISNIDSSTVIKPRDIQLGARVTF
jgi:hypothetical protein